MKVWTLYDQDVGSEGICVFDSKTTLARYIRENYAEKLANDFAGDFDMLSDDGLLRVAEEADAGFWFNEQELQTMATMDEDEEEWAKIRIATMGEAKNDEDEDVADDPENPANRARGDTPFVTGEAASTVGTPVIPKQKRPPAAPPGPQPQLNPQARHQPVKEIPDEDA